MKEKDPRKALIEILAIASRSESKSSEAANPGDEERLKMIENVAKAALK